jgi:hypothetical protein
MIDWVQIATVGGGVLTVIVSIGTAVRWLDSRINHLNDKSEVRLEKTIKEWRDEHKSQMNEWRGEHSKQIEKNESHWREMFTHFNTRLDSMAGNK